MNPETQYRDGAASPVGGFGLTANDIAQIVAAASREASQAAAAAAARETATVMREMMAMMGAAQPSYHADAPVRSDVEKVQLPRFDETS
jgi:hypothetical protein